MITNIIHAPYMNVDVNTEILHVTGSNIVLRKKTVLKECMQGMGKSMLTQ
jgi:hypothetical protein